MGGFVTSELQRKNEISLRPRRVHSLTLKRVSGDVRAVVEYEDKDGHYRIDEVDIFDFYTTLVECCPIINMHCRRYTNGEREVEVYNDDKPELDMVFRIDDNNIQSGKNIWLYD